MNCQNFENILDDLARGALMDARTREAAHAHADTCRRCDSRLSDEKSLRAGLRSLAATKSGREAPPRVESALLAAFRAQAGKNAGATESTSAPLTAPLAVPVAAPAGNVAPLKRRAADKQWSWVKTVATAATAAAAAAVLLMIIPPGMDAPPAGGGTVAEVGTKAGEREVSPQVQKTTAPVQSLESKDESRPTITEVADVEEPSAANPTRGGGGRMTATPVSYNPAGGRRPQAARGGPRGAKPNQEVVTEFIPLGNGEYSASVDAGQVVRVELPRSALSSIGLPVSADRASERIKADVLVGEDGVARAIRFVR